MIDTAPFGRTGHDSTRVIFGAAALGAMRQEKADQVLDLLLEYGINHIDTAASYGDSELRIGPWMERYRERFFLASKTGDRTYAGARDSERRSVQAAHSKRSLRLASRVWYASSASPATARASPRCIGAASNAFRSTRS